jgi:tetratricopeptide (TPR) repeat protein
MSPGLVAVLGILFVVTAGAFLYMRTPAYGRLLLRRAAMLASTGRIDRMIALLQRNRRRSSVRDPLTNALVFFYIRSAMFDEAEKVVLEAMEKGDRSGTAIAQLGFSAAGRGDRKAAESLYRKAMERDPDLRKTLTVNIAGLLIETGERLDEAESLLMEALDLREGEARGGVHINLALLYLKLKEPRDALIHAMTGYEVQPVSELTRLGRGQALALAARASEMLGEKTECAQLASKALKLVNGLAGSGKLVSELESLAGRSASPAAES